MKIYVNKANLERILASMNLIRRKAVPVSPGISALTCYIEHVKTNKKHNCRTPFVVITFQHKGFVYKRAIRISRSGKRLPESSMFILLYDWENRKVLNADNESEKRSGNICIEANIIFNCKPVSIPNMAAQAIINIPSCCFVESMQILSKHAEDVLRNKNTTGEIIPGYMYTHNGRLCFVYAQYKKMTLCATFTDKGSFSPAGLEVMLSPEIFYFLKTGFNWNTRRQAKIFVWEDTIEIKTNHTFFSFPRIDMEKPVTFYTEEYNRNIPNESFYMNYDYLPVANTVFNMTYKIDVDRLLVCIRNINDLYKSCGITSRNMGIKFVYDKDKDCLDCYAVLCKEALSEKKYIIGRSDCVADRYRMNRTVYLDMDNLRSALITCPNEYTTFHMSSSDLSQNMLLAIETDNMIMPKKFLTHVEFISFHSQEFEDLTQTESNGKKGGS